MTSSTFVTTLKDPNLALREAANEGSSRKIEQLLKQKNVDINSCGSTSGERALHRAARQGNTRIIAQLVGCGADFTLTSNAGKTAETIAHESNQRDAEQLLKNFALAAEAIAVAQSFFQPAHEVVHETAVDKDVVIMRKMHEKIFEEHQAKILRKFSGDYQLKRAFSELDPALQQKYMGRMQFLSEVASEIIAAGKLQPHQRKGYCGELTRAAALYLFNKTNAVVEQIAIKKGNLNHSFLVIGRSYNSNHLDPRSWDASVICDPDYRVDNKIYSTAYNIDGTPIDHIIKGVVEMSYFYPQNPQGLPANLKTFLEAETCDLIKEAMDVLRQGSKLLSVADQSKEKEMDIEAPRLK